MKLYKIHFLDYIKICKKRSFDYIYIDSKVLLQLYF